MSKRLFVIVSGYLTAILCTVAAPGNAICQSASSKALAFEKRDYVEIQGVKSFNLNGTFTVEMWVTWSNRDHSSQYFFGDDAWPGMSDKISVKQESGCALRTTRLSRHLRAIEMVLGSTNNWFVVTGKQLPEVGGWHHLAVSKSPQVVRLFRDGKLDAEKPCTGVTFNPSPTNLYLGVRQYAFTDRVFHGVMRGFHISSSARYEQNFKPPRTLTKDLDTVILYDFSAGKGDQLLDLSGDHHDGLIVGARWVDLRKLGSR